MELKRIGFLVMICSSNLHGMQRFVEKEHDGLSAQQLQDDVTRAKLRSSLLRELIEMQKNNRGKTAFDFVASEEIRSILNRVG